MVFHMISTPQNFRTISDLARLPCNRSYLPRADPVDDGTLRFCSAHNATRDSHCLCDITQT